MQFGLVIDGVDKYIQRLFPEIISERMESCLLPCKFDQVVFIEPDLCAQKIGTFPGTFLEFLASSIAMRMNLRSFLVIFIPLSAKQNAVQLVV